VPWTDLRQPVDIILEKLDARGAAFFTAAALMIAPPGETLKSKAFLGSPIAGG
jgi:hypothetical protein